MKAFSTCAVARDDMLGREAVHTRVVAIDGSKFKAVNSRDNNFRPNKVARRREQIKKSIQRYLEALETADRTQSAELEAKTERLREKIETLADVDRASELLNDPP